MFPRYWSALVVEEEAEEEVVVEAEAEAEAAKWKC